MLVHVIPEVATLRYPLCGQHVVETAPTDKVGETKTLREQLGNALTTDIVQSLVYKLCARVATEVHLLREVGSVDCLLEVGVNTSACTQSAPVFLRLRVKTAVQLIVSLHVVEQSLCRTHDRTGICSRLL